MRSLLERIEMSESEESGYDIFKKKALSLAKSFDSTEANSFIKWAKENIALDFVPRGQKETAKYVNFVMHFAKVASYGSDYPNPEKRVIDDLSHIDQDVFNKHFVIGDKSNIPVEYKGKFATYKNIIGFPAKKIEKIADGLDSILGELSGWRKKATNGLVIGLAGPKTFMGTAAGKYGSEEDILYVRATDAVLKRGAKSYASPEYIIIHELGHRYDRKFGSFDMNDLSSWFTTPYSMTSEEEAFAELFALGHFGITKAHREWDPMIQKRFEERMKGSV